MRINFIARGEPDRSRAEAHVRGIYRDAYGADVPDFAPLLVAATNSAGNIDCVAGIRIARDGFFSDAYLDQPIEIALSNLGRGTVPPEAVLEVVSLASASPFSVLPVIDAIIAWGRRRGISWGVFTATEALRRQLTRAGMPYVELRAAMPDRLADPAAWGSYYASDPRVCAFGDTLDPPLALTRRVSRRAEAR